MSVKPTLLELILNATAAGKSMLSAANAAAQKTLLSLVKSDVGLGNVDNTSDTNKPVSTAQQTALDLKANLASPALTGTPTAPTAADGTNTTQIASTAYVVARVASAVTGLLEFQGNIDCSANPNYPAASEGDTYYVSVAGKIGGASGVTVAVGDAVVCKVDNAGGTEASVGTSWFALEKNLAGALLSANNLSDVADTATARTNLGLGTLATQSGTFSGTHSGTSSNTNTGDQFLFSTIAVSGQSSVVADATSDTLTLIAGTNITITTSATNDEITITASGGGSPGGSTTQVQFNDAGSFGGDSQLTFNKTTGLLAITGAGATGVKILETLPGSGTSYVRLHDNGTVIINADVSTGTYPLRLLYNGVEKFSFSYDAMFLIAAGGQLNIGSGLMTLNDLSGVARINTWNELDIRPGGLGGPGTKRINVVAQNAADQPFRIKGAASQSGNLEQWVSSADVVYGTISENGYFTTRKVAAPADAELSASELAYWFDDTNGAGKFKIKAKTANGTVVTGEVALT